MNNFKLVEKLLHCSFSIYSKSLKTSSGSMYESIDWQLGSAVIWLLKDLML